MQNNRLLWKIKDGAVPVDDLPWIEYWIQERTFSVGLYGVILLATAKIYESLVILS